MARHRIARYVAPRTQWEEEDKRAETGVPFRITPAHSTGYTSVPPYVSGQSLALSQLRAS